MLRSHLVHHGRFYAAALLGLIVWSATSRAASSLRPVIAGDVFFATYLVSTAMLALRATPDDMRRRASYEDEGILVIVLLTLGAIGFCLAAIFALLNDPERPAAARVVLTLARRLTQDSPLRVEWRAWVMGFDSRRASSSKGSCSLGSLGMRSILRTRCFLSMTWSRVST